MPPPGKHWHYSLVRSILTQPAYTGRGYFNRTRNCHEVIGRAKQCGRGQLRYPKSKPRPRSEWVEVTVPAILSEEIWHQAQEKLAMKQKFAKRNNKRHFYLLRSLLVCDLCGRTLSGRTYKEQATYFCGNHGKHATPGTTAHTRTIKGQIIEPLIWDAVVKLLRNPNLMMDAWASQGKPQEITPEEADQLEARLRTLQRQWVRILDAFQDGLVLKEELALRKKRLEQEKHTVEQRLHQIRHQVHQAHEQSQVLKDFTAFCQQIDASLNDPSPETKQKVIRLLIDHVVVGENEIVIKHIVPTDDDCRLLSERIFANHRE